MRLTVVGCSGSVAGPESPASSYLVTVEDGDGRTWRLVMDLGSGALGPLQRHTDLAHVDAVLITHLHPDHFIDLCGYYVALKYGPSPRERGRLPVYGPQATAHRVAAAYGTPDGDGIGEQMDFRSWVDGEPVQIGPVTVTPYRVQHPIEAYGFRLEWRGPDGRPRALAYTGDTDDCPGLDRVAADADLLLSEAAFQEGRDTVRGIHLTGARAGQVATRCGVRRLVLTHLPPWNDPEVALAEARQTFAGALEVAVPDGELTLD